MVDKNTIAVFSFIFSTGLVVALVIYFSLSITVGNAVLTYADNLYEMQERFQMLIRGDDGLAFIESFCDTEPFMEWDRPGEYSKQLSNCNDNAMLSVVNEFHENTSSNITVAYMSYYMCNAIVKNTQKHLFEVFEERYPQESHLFFEKLYDVMSVIMVIGAAGMSTTEQGVMFTSCIEDVQNGTYDTACLYSFLEGLEGMAQRIEQNTYFDESFVVLCTEHFSTGQFRGFEDIPIINPHNLCTRARSVFQETLEKSRANPPLDSGTRFFTALHLYNIAHHGEYQTYIPFLRQIVGEEVDPEYAPRFQAALDELQNN